MATIYRDSFEVEFTVNGKIAKHLFDCLEQETLDPIEAVDWVDEAGELYYIIEGDIVTVSVKYL